MTCTYAEWARCDHPACDRACQNSVPSMYQECARVRGFTCILGTGCNRTPICERPECAAQTENREVPSDG